MGRRPLLAAVLALAIAGLGHAYLRRWGRAAAWFVLIVGSGLALISTFADPETPVAELPLSVLGPLVALFFLSAVDAYRLASRASAASASSASTLHFDGNDSVPNVDGDDPIPDVDGDVPSCPNCGKDLDPDLDFCPWCTHRLDDTEE